MTVFRAVNIKSLFYEKYNLVINKDINKQKISNVTLTHYKLRTWTLILVHHKSRTKNMNHLTLP